MFPILVILGPTAVGKTEIAIQLAERMDGEIVSADSRMFYRGMDIGTAKPSLQYRNRVPHHLIDITEPDQPWSLATFQDSAHQAMIEIHARGHLPMLVGGTGQYLRAVIQDWQLPGVEPDWRLREALDDWAGEIGSAGLHRRLGVIDPQAASSIEPRNLRRSIRALEVIFTTGIRFSEQRRSGSSRYQVLQVGLNMPRAVLYERIDRRIESMLESGLVDEVKNLLERGFPPDLPVFSAIGYRQIIAYLQGSLALSEAEMGIKRTTRVLVRRQANWFKADDPGIHWFDLSTTGVDSIVEFIRSWLTLNPTAVI
ncbi:MAG: tRNA (adenosine(37)-N6)-dimethylallyltransferase MiaA [Chloroflexi bacterium RBG_16_54_18]|nr:MAG: tRNA (adenosine(37)-N6)-dimethylallyltransferase MiaA [Chloroflexi bacterium RBG_16_54_18]